MMKPLLIICVICQILGYGFALDYKGVEEYFTCDKFVVDPNLDPSWLANIPVCIYTTLWNKIDLYQNAEDMLGKDEFAKMTVQDLDRTCAYYSPNISSVVIHGFGERTVRYGSFPDPIRKGITHWSLPDETGEPKYHATTYITKTDNKSYFVGSTVWANGMKGFTVGSNIPKLNENTFQEIKKHLTEIGFKPEHFVEQNYDNCPPPPDSLQSDKQKADKMN